MARVLKEVGYVIKSKRPRTEPQGTRKTVKEAASV